tara:strand:- start:188 stop:499 length:312 start_codon:yes stop_codon:yes gene_type:complete
MPTSNSLYYYGKYSNTLYNFKSDMNDKQLEIHIEELHNIIELSKKKKKRVPPGIYAELGFYYSKKEQFSDALNFYELEKNTYPESSKFMTALINNIDSNEDSK